MRGMLGEDDRRRLAENPLRVLDSKDPAVRELVASPDFPKMVDLLSTLDPASDAHHRELKALLVDRKVPFKEDPLLVRGLDYYTRTVFEVTAEGLGAQDALLGGGRYDRLVSDLGGPKTPGIGFAIGEDRLVEVLPESFRKSALEGACAVAVVPVGSPDMPEAFDVAGELARGGDPGRPLLRPPGPRPGPEGGREVRARPSPSSSGRTRRARGAVVVKNLASADPGRDTAREALAGVLRQRL